MTNWLCFFSTANSKVGKAQLWHFLLERLSDFNNSIIRWEGNYGEFRILDPEKLAKLWGEKSSRPKMSYQTMSRAMRHYYGKGILSKVKHKKWCYRFSRNALEMAVNNDLVTDFPYTAPPTACFYPRPEYYQPYSLGQDFVNGRSLFASQWSYDLTQYQQETLGMFMDENFSLSPFSPNIAYFWTDELLKKSSLLHVSF